MSDRWLPRITAQFTKNVNGFRAYGGRDPEGNYVAFCDCGTSIVGLQDRSAVIGWVRTEIAHHTLKIASKA